MSQCQAPAPLPKLAPLEGAHAGADRRLTPSRVLTGVYTNSYDPTLNARNGFPVFSTLVEANHVAKTEDLFAAYKLTDEDKHDIHKLARDPRIGADCPLSQVGRACHYQTR